MSKNGAIYPVDKYITHKSWSALVDNLTGDNPIMKGYCDGCQYRKKIHAVRATYCGYILIVRTRRGCPAGKGCTKKVIGKELKLPDGELPRFGFRLNGRRFDDD